ncbi:MAG: hypothetical protein AB7I19_03650 [Planctomycetota bacterium]
MSNASKLPPQIPFVIAVTGPIESIRDLPAERRTALRQLVKDQFFRVLFVPAIHARWTAEETPVFDPPRLRSTPVVVLTNGADGFDALVEEAIAELVGPTDLPIQVARVWPFAPSVPMRSKDFVLPAIQDGVKPGDALQYRFAGYCLLRFARVLLTVDGRDEHGVSESIVRMARSGRIADSTLRERLRQLPPELLHKIGLSADSLHELEPIGVVELPVAEQATGDAFLWWLRPLSSEHEASSRHAFDDLFRETLTRLDRVNGDLRVPPGRDGYAIEEAPPAHLEPLHDLFLHVDAAASRNQRTLWTHLTRIQTLVFLGALLFVSGSHCFAPISHLWSTTLTFGLVLCVAVAALIHDRGRRERLEARTWDLRNFSESLRVRYSWRRAGIKDLLAQHQLTYHRNELTWIRAAIDSLVFAELRDQQRGQSLSQPDVRVDKSIEAWLVDQYAYYRKQLPVREGKAVESENARSALIQVSIVAALVSTLVLGLHDPRWSTALFLGGLAVCAWTFWRRRTYHSDVLARMEHPLRDTERGVRIAVWLASLAILVVTCAWASSIAKSVDPVTGRAEWIWHNVATLMVILPALFGALFHARAESHGWSAEARRFAQMIHIYRGALDRLLDLAELTEEERTLFHSAPRKHAEILTTALAAKNRLDHPVVRALLLRVGSESLTEHAEWLFLHRDRPIDVPYHV